MPRKTKVTDSPYDIGVTDTIFDAMLEASREKYGDCAVFTGTEAEQRIVGVPLPALSLRYLFQSNVLPLGRIMGLNGKQGCCKSAMLYEVFRWHRAIKGLSFYLENETKDSPELRNSILNYDTKAVTVHPTPDMDAWMSAMNFYIQRFQKTCDGTEANPGLGRRAAMCLGLDSLMGTVCKETSDKYDKAPPGRSFPAEALKVAAYLRYLPPIVYGWPITIAFTNHLKPSTDASGRATSHTPGGIAPHFHATYEIEMVRLADLHSAEIEGHKIQLTMTKNSLGPSRRRIVAEMHWYYDFPADGSAVVQRTYWDWHAASVEMLLALNNPKKTPRRLWNKICEIIDLHPKSAGGKRVWSNAVGVPSTDAISYRKMGLLIEKTPEILAALHAALGVRTHLPFEPGADFCELMEQANERARAVVSRVQVIHPWAEENLEDAPEPDDVSVNEAVEEPEDAA